MRILVLADVHANGEALRALQRAERQPDAVLFAGDAVGYGPEVVDCARWLLANATAAVRGNHEDALADGDFEGMPPGLEAAARATIDYARRTLRPEDVSRLRAWPAGALTSLGGATFSLRHAPDFAASHEWNPATASAAELHASLDAAPADVYVFGHTHLPALRQFGQRLIINPGSLGQPRYGMPDATYAVWEDGQVQIKHLRYDHRLTARRLRLAALDPDVSQQLARVLESGSV